MHGLSARNRRGNNTRGQGGPHEVGSTLDLATVHEVGSADDGNDVQDSMIIDFPNSAVVTSRDTSSPVNSDEPSCGVMPNAAGGDCGKSERTLDDEIYVLDPKIGDRLPDPHVPSRIPATTPRPITRGRKGTYLEEVHTVVGGKQALIAKKVQLWSKYFRVQKRLERRRLKRWWTREAPSPFIQNQVWKRMVDIGGGHDCRCPRN